MEPLRAPMPYFGGKRAVAAEVWARFGAVKNYVEPFFGSGAVLLARPTLDANAIESVNDADGLLCNFWRAIRSSPDAVAEAVDWPVSEADLHSRHAVLVERRADLTERLMGDPEFCDPKLAGWWAFGACSWIGTGWCSGKGPWVRRDGRLVLDDASKLPHLGDAGRGINRKLPHLGDTGRGINRQLPHLGGTNRGTGVNKNDANALEWFAALSARLRRVRIACGDWSRVCGPSVTWRHGLTAVFLDPPYAAGNVEYAVASSPAEAARAWALEQGVRPDMRIALCGHDGEHAMPGWTVFRWTARGGYGNQGGEADADNRHMETIWFSPACLGWQGELWK